MLQSINNYGWMGWLELLSKNKWSFCLAFMVTCLNFVQSYILFFCKSTSSFLLQMKPVQFLFLYMLFCNNFCFICNSCPLCWLLLFSILFPKHISLEVLVDSLKANNPSSNLVDELIWTFVQLLILVALDETNSELYYESTFISSMFSTALVETAT